MNSTANALWFLARKQFFGSLRRARKRPRLVLPVLFFAALLLFQVILPFALRSVLGGRMDAERREVLFAPPQYTAQSFVTGGPGVLVASVRGLLFLSVLSALIAALGEGGTGGLVLSPADVDNLFPAPLKRRSVLFFKIVGRWAALLIPAAYLPLAIASTAIKAWTAPSPLAYWPGILGVWLWMASVTNVTLAVSLWRIDKHETGETPHKTRESVRRVVIALVWITLAVFVYLMLGGLSGLMSSGTRTRANPAHFAAVQTFLQAAHSRIVGVGAAPIAWASDLFLTAFRPWQWADGGRIAGLLLLFAGSVWALFSRDRDFYENALDTTAKRAKVTQALRSGDAGTVLSQMAQDGRIGKSRRIVRTVGPGAGAILWKDLVGVGRTPARSWVTLLLVAAFPALFGVLFGRQNNEVGVLAWMVTFTLQMSGFFLLGMRDMLRRADVSKALPIAPLPFIAAELAVSVGLQSVLGWFSLTLSSVVGMGFGPLVQAAYFVFPTLAALVLFVQAIFVLLYPQKNDAAQSVVGNATALVASLVSLVPSLLAAVVLFMLRVPVLTIGAAVAVINAGCAFAALCLAAWLWRRFDPSDG